MWLLLIHVLHLCPIGLLVHLFLESISGCLMKDAVLVFIHPLVIGGKPVEEKFLDYEPMKLRLVSTLKTQCQLVTESQQLLGRGGFKGYFQLLSSIKPRLLADLYYQLISHRLSA